MGIDDLIMLAKKRGVDTISITDHDCQAGSVRGRIIAARRGVTVVPGVELSASDAETGRQVHILGYFCDSPDRLEELCHKNNAARKKRAVYDSQGGSALSYLRRTCHEMRRRFDRNL